MTRQQICPKHHQSEILINKTTFDATTLAVTTAALIGSIASPNLTPGWFAHIRKPAYQPPNAVFPVVWTTLYGDIATTSAEVIDRFRASAQHDKARGYIGALGVNLVLNAGWSWLFFRCHKLGASALGALVLTASSADLARRAADADSRVGAALTPYPLWCAFATVLSTHIWRLNR